MGISRSEKAALRAIKRGEKIAPDLEEKLILKGLIERGLGGLMITVKGKRALEASRGIEM